MLVRVFNAAIVFVLEFIIFAIRIRIAPLPESLDVLVALFIIGELHERLAFIISDDPAHILIEPFLVRGFQFSLY